MTRLKPGGKLVVVTPNVEGAAATLFGAYWRGWEPPRHLHLFSVKTLKNFLLKSDFEVTEARTSSAGAAVIYRVSRISQQKKVGHVSFMFQLGLIIWAYKKELAEFKSQKAGHHAGQNLLVCTTKPLYQAN